MARALASGDPCAAAQAAARLRKGVTDAINAGQVPEVYLEDLSGVANEIEVQIPECVEPAPLEDEADDGDDRGKGKGRKKGKKNEKKDTDDNRGGDDEEPAETTVPTETEHEPPPTTTESVPETTTTGTTTRDAQR